MSDQSQRCTGCSGDATKVSSIWTALKRRRFPRCSSDDWPSDLAWLCESPRVRLTEKGSSSITCSTVLHQKVHREAVATLQASAFQAASYCSEDISLTEPGP